MEGGKRMAVLAGCNYFGSMFELHGCINDVVSMIQVLVARFGFKEEDIELLTDEATSSVKPTGANIKSALKRMVERAEEGDVIFFHFSGHGTLIQSLKPHEPHRKDEAIVPCDFNFITDVDLRQLVNRLPPKVTFTILSDSCHSGGLIDQEKEQIGRSTLPPMKKPDYSKPKFIPYESILEQLKQLTGLDTSKLGDLMIEHFKDEASLTFRLSEAEQDNIRAIRAKKGDYGILLSGCQSDEMSREEEKGKPHGVFSYAVQTVLERPRTAQVTNKEVVMQARELLHKQGVKHQHPCLYCSDHNVDAAFLLEPQIH